MAPPEAVDMEMTARAEARDIEWYASRYRRLLPWMDAVYTQMSLAMGDEQASVRR